MAKKRKTREEKVKSQYRLSNFKLQVEETASRKDREEFSYLGSEYVVRDLTKTLIYTALMVTILLLAKRYLS